MEKIHLVMPMGGAGSRFYENGYMQPKPLIEINGKPFFYWAARSVTKFLNVQDITFVVLKLHIEEHSIDRVIKQYFPDANIKVLEKVLPGPVCTSLKAVEDIQDKAPVLFNDCDHMFKCAEIERMFNNEKFALDGALLTFESDNPQFSYIRYDSQGNMIGTAEKQVVSNHAICGAYIFKNADLFKSIAEEYIKNCPYHECFMSGMYSIMCQKKMLIHDYLLDFHVDFGTPEEYEKAKNSCHFEELM